MRQGVKSMSDRESRDQRGHDLHLCGVCRKYKCFYFTGMSVRWGCGADELEK